MSESWSADCLISCPLILKYVVNGLEDIDRPITSPVYVDLCAGGGGAGEQALHVLHLVHDEYWRGRGGDMHDIYHSFVSNLVNFIEKGAGNLMYY
jgi:hypothetical protein